MPILSEILSEETLSSLEKLKKALEKQEWEPKSLPSIKIEDKKINLKNIIWKWTPGEKPSRIEGKRKVVEIGKTFNTSLNAHPGDILTVQIEEMTVLEDSIAWAKPKVSNVDLRKEKPYSLNQAISLSKRFPETLQIEKAKVGVGGEYGRDRFNVKEEDKGSLWIQEHLRGLTEDQANEFKEVKSYEDWQNTKKLLAEKDVTASCHSDIRIKMSGEDHLIGFTATSPPNIKEESRVLHPEEEKPILIAGFKLKQPISWSKVGKGKADIVDPGDVGATSHSYAIFYMVGWSEIEIIYVKESGHALSFNISESTRIPEGIWNLNYVPIEKGKRLWMLNYVGKK